MPGDPVFKAHVERHRDGTCVVVVAGEADLYAAPELEQRLAECTGDGVTQVVVDLGEAQLLDSTALGVLVAARKRLARQNVPLKLVCRDRLILRVLKITALDRLFAVYETTSEALADGSASADRGARDLARRGTA